jgi:hypothetical protein
MRVKKDSEAGFQNFFEEVKFLFFDVVPVL